MDIEELPEIISPRNKKKEKPEKQEIELEPRPYVDALKHFLESIPALNINLILKNKNASLKIFNHVTKEDELPKYCLLSKTKKEVDDVIEYIRNDYILGVFHLKPISISNEVLETDDIIYL